MSRHDPKFEEIKMGVYSWEKILSVVRQLRTVPNYNYPNYPNYLKIVINGIK